ncbi:putative ANTH domain-containing protein [Helianthus annuus]|uniref:ANTH domain-containing protein n=1 Tax=Helianthus annuus TaxID=4232 RepID=A0A9K3P681_HELAN|nr:putative ANTH domain-containing protein [Helianthus annuus]KAJ0628692.1 putative ANTH domain, ENTH domain-containing protein [Helianthus annuus]
MHVFIVEILAATYAIQPRVDVQYSLHVLTRRLAKTRNWTVASKTLIVIHRALQEGDPAFTEELRVLQLATFKDDSSPIDLLKVKISGTHDLDSEKLLEQLPSLQQLLYRLMACKAESLSDFYEVCKRLELARNFQLPVFREFM